MTKSDKLNKTQTAERMSKIRSEIPYGDEITIIPFSSETGEGVEEVKKIITQVAVEAQNDVLIEDEDNEDIKEDKDNEEVDTDDVH